MAIYPVSKIRNVCLLGHGGDGKTSLAESLLFLTGASDRLGKVADGNTVCDFDPEEIRRQYTISAASAPVELDGYKINVLDTPGYFDFQGEVRQALRVADTAIIFAPAKNGVEVGTEKSWKSVNTFKKPRFFYVSKLDEEHADFYKTVEALRAQFGISVCPVVLPILEGGKPVGVVNIATKKASKLAGNKMADCPIPADMNDQVEEYRGVLSEAIAETSEELMEKFFGGEEFTDAEIMQGLREGIRTMSIAPLVCGSASNGVGSIELLRCLIAMAPSPDEMPAEVGEDASGESVEIKSDDNGKSVAVVFKTVADQYGRFSFFKVVSGKVSSDMTLTNPRSGQNEKMGHIYVVRGKKNNEVDAIGCGDIGAVSKLTDTKTGDTLCAAGLGITLPGITFDAPCYSQAIAPKSKGGEEKIASGLAKLKDEDPTFTIENNAETKQLVISGAGDIHIDVLCSKLKSKFGVEVELSEPRVPYREKIRKKVSMVEGKHKKQSGGHGQYGHVKMDFEPTDEADFIFEEKIFGGSVPKNFHPAVEKGIRESMVKGVIAGYPMVGLKAILMDGSYHDVDSNELSFKMAARLAYKAGIPQASPVLLEPVGTLKVYIPDANMGDIIGDLNKRRGRIMGMNPTDDGLQCVEAEVPMAEVSSYAIDLRSMTQGRGSFELKFERYDEAPPMVQQKIVEESKNLADDDE